MEKTRIGLIVNPVAGMGGSVGLKGTDGKEMVARALALGAEPVTPEKTRQLLEHIGEMDRLELLVAPGQMGQRAAEALGIPHKVVGVLGDETDAADTQRIAREMEGQGVKLLIFVGGDGTARDVYDTLGDRVPVVAVPAGVKIYSSVFAVSTRAAAEMVDAFVQGAELAEEEVLDIDEDAYREDRLASRLYGYLVVPEVRAFLQPGKVASSLTQSSRVSKQEIAAFIIEEMDAETLYLMGPGTTVKAIADEMGQPKTLLGVDAFRDRRLLEEDINERDILRLLQAHGRRKILVTPIGGNGFIFGRGSKQFTPEVIWQVGRENILVVGTRDKLSQLDCLRVDTGDFALDEHLSGYLRVWVGYREGMVLRVRC